MSQLNNAQAAALAKISLLFKHLSNHEQNNFVVTIYNCLVSLQNLVKTGSFSLATRQIELLKDFLGETSEILFAAILNDINDLCLTANEAAPSPSALRDAVSAFNFNVACNDSIRIFFNKNNELALQNRGYPENSAALIEGTPEYPLGLIMLENQLCVRLTGSQHGWESTGISADDMAADVLAFIPNVQMADFTQENGIEEPAISEQNQAVKSQLNNVQTAALVKIESALNKIETLAQKPRGLVLLSISDIFQESQHGLNALHDLKNALNINEVISHA